MATIEDKREEVANGAVLASFLAAGIGAFAVGFFVIINEAGLFSAPALYGPAGGVSGRTTFAAVTWLIGGRRCMAAGRPVSSSRIGCIRPRWC